MVVTFSPFAGSSADVYAGFANFIRCVQAVATANANTSSLTVYPMLANTGAVDITKNCIISIDSSDEAGGWTTSTASNVPQEGVAWTGANSPASTYKLELYRSSGKSALPFYRFAVHGFNQINTKTSGTGSSTSWTNLNPNIAFTFGAGTTNDATSTSHFPVAGTYGVQTNGATLSSPGAGAISGTFIIPSFCPVPAITNIQYKIAVTQNYIIIWEHNTNNSYASGYSNVLNASTNIPQNYYRHDYTYGAMMYAGLRETQPWENALNNNPPWVIAHWQHVTSRGDRSGISQTAYMDGRQEVCASLTTMTNTGTASASPTVYYSNNNMSYGSDPVTLGPAPHQTNTGYSSLGLVEYNGFLQTLGASVPNNGLNRLFSRKSNVNTSSQVDYYAQIRNNLYYLPSIDPDTGTLVPPAEPIVISRNVSDSWTPGGALKGIYKSLGCPLATMKLYFSDGQTFTVNGDTYMPVIFHEDMYLIRKA